MTRVIHPDTEFETNEDCSRFQINFDPSLWLPEEVVEIRYKLKRMGFPVCEPGVKEPNSIVFSTLAMGAEANTP